MPFTRLSCGSILFATPLVFVSMELSRDWCYLRLSWPIWILYLLVGSGGLLGGALLAERNALLGALTGTVAAFGALVPLVFVLNRTSFLANGLIVAAGGIGALPGLVLYHWINNWLRQRSSAQTSA